jgi:hypothetical protein
LIDQPGRRPRDIKAIAAESLLAVIAGKAHLSQCGDRLFEFRRNVPHGRTVRFVHAVGCEGDGSRNGGNQRTETARLLINRTDSTVGGEDLEKIVTRSGSCHRKKMRAVRKIAAGEGTRGIDDPDSSGRN